MKNQIKPIITALLLGAFTFASAKTLPVSPKLKSFATGIYKLDGKPIFNVNINKLKGAVVTIVIKDSKGEIVFEDMMRKSVTTYRTKINMAELKKGKYTLELNDGVNIETKKIEL